VHNMLFKFAVDSYGILGSDYAAAKVAGNELKGLISYFNTGILELRVPLMALVDYMGFRLVVMSLLPINNNTLVYGTSDAGVVIHNSNSQLFEIMKKSARILNLKPHICGLKSKLGLILPGWKLLYSAADVEGHVGTDGKYYILDFSRSLPPEAINDASPKGAHLYRLLRPEFVKMYQNPLCSDAYSGFIMADPNCHVHHQGTLPHLRYTYCRYHRMMVIIVTTTTSN
jgi:hypothetical protein